MRLGAVRATPRFALQISQLALALLPIGQIGAQEALEDAAVVGDGLPAMSRFHLATPLYHCTHA